MRLFKRGCEVGLSPSMFWEMEVADIAQYIEYRSEEDRRQTYSLSILTAQFFAITLSNAFRREGTPPTDYPRFDEVFAREEVKTPEKSGQEMLDARIAELRMQFAHRLPGGQNNG